MTEPITAYGLLAGAGTVISILFWRYIASQEARLADCKEDGQRDRDTIKELRAQILEATRAVDKLADAIEAGNRLREMERAK